MTRFTDEQYDKAIRHLQDARTQLEPNGHGCHCCGGSGHQAFECGHNPLVAMAMCRDIAEHAAKMHEHLHAFDVDHATPSQLREIVDTAHELVHTLAGMNTYMGVQTGPARVVLP